jgi:hypothetical protein
VIYTPAYLNHLVAYYGGDGLRSRELEGRRPAPAGRGGRVFLLASFLDKRQHRDETAKAVRELKRDHTLVRSSRYPQIRVWEFR